MSIVMMMISFMIQIMMLIIRAAAWCGLLYAFLIWGALGLLMEYVFHVPHDSPLQMYYTDAGLIFMIVFTALWTLRKLIKGMKPDFSYSGAVAGIARAGKEKVATRGSASGELKHKSPEGVVFGKSGISYVCKPLNDSQHLMIIGPPGTGKSAAIITPSIMSWPQENGLLVVDIKSELAEKCTRENIKIFNPFAANSYAYDPFWLVKRSSSPAQEIRQMAVTLIPDAIQGDNYWQSSAQNLFSGAALTCFENGYSFIDTVAYLQTHTGRELVDMVMTLGSDTAKMYVNQLRELDSKPLGSVYSNMSNALIVFATDEVLRAALNPDNAEGIITPDDLENGAAIFLQIPENKLAIWKDFVAMLLQQFLHHFESRPVENSKPILFIIDELPRLGQIPAVLDGAATLRGRGVVLTMAAQDKSQLSAIYGKDQAAALLGNCGWKAILGVLGGQDQRDFADMIGKWDKTKKSKGASGSGLDASSSFNETTEQRYRVEPDELGHLGDDLILLSPAGFSRIKKCYWFKDGTFKKLA